MITVDAAKEMERITGIPSAESRRIFEEVKLNHARLDGCAGPHEFTPLENANPFRRKWMCDKCGGTVDNIAHHWYQRGLEHGKLILTNQK